MFAGLVGSDYVVGLVVLFVIGFFIAVQFAPRQTGSPPEDFDGPDPSHGPAG